jgi:protein-tyrosine phosphatase
MAGSGVGASQGAREVLAREGINVSRHISREVTKEMAQRSDLILIMEKLHEAAILKIAPLVKNRVFLLKEFAKIDENNLDIADPSGQPMGYYEDVFVSIKEALERVSKLI